jgi:hypothetical protein
MRVRRAEGRPIPRRTSSPAAVMTLPRNVTDFRVTAYASRNKLSGRPRASSNSLGLNRCVPDADTHRPNGDPIHFMCKQEQSRHSLPY